MEHRQIHPHLPFAGSHRLVVALLTLGLCLTLSALSMPGAVQAAAPTAIPTMTPATPPASAGAGQSTPPNTDEVRAESAGQGAALSAPATPPVTPVSPIILFQSDFSTQGERWKLINDNADAAVQYVENGLSLAITPANYAIWSYPDTDLRPGSADLSMTVGWEAGASDAVVGLIVQFRSDNDMQIATLSRAGDLRYGSYVRGVFTDAVAPIQVTLAPDALIHLRAVLNHAPAAAGAKAQDTLTIYVNSAASLKISFVAGRAGRFGVYARSGSEPGLSFILRDFVVSIPQ